MNFDQKIFDVRQKRRDPFLVAHRGVCGANVPCNTMTAFKIAVDQGADVVELDVSRSKDGVHYVFHPGMEPVFLKSKRLISEMTSEEVDAMFLVNSDTAQTSYKVPRLAEALEFLKGRAYINVDKFWTDVEGISRVIREVGVEKQVIVKTFTEEESLNAVAKYASDFMFMPLVKGKDTVTDALLARGVNVIGTEILFAEETEDVISDEYIRRMHEKGLLIWVNSIIYNERDVISAYHTDDISLSQDPSLGWGWICDKGADFIQTDWLLMVKDYLAKRA